MVTITLTLPDDLKKQMDQFKEFNWNSIILQVIQERLTMLQTLDKFTKNSTLTEEDALKLGRKVNAAVSKRFREERNLP